MPSNPASSIQMTPLRAFSCASSLSRNDFTVFASVNPSRRRTPREASAEGSQHGEGGYNRHITGDVREILNDGWDLLMVAHPPCTRLCNSGVRWLSVPPVGKSVEQILRELDEGAAHFSDLWNAPIPRICVENPIMHKHAKSRIRNYQPPAQTIQPWQFGHGETKATTACG